MRPLGLVIPLLLLGAGCSIDDPPLDNQLRFLRDPDSGMCVPIMASDNAESAPYAEWAPCENPCAGLDEMACSADPRCAPRFGESMCPPNADCVPGHVFVACDPNPQPDECLGLDEQT